MSSGHVRRRRPEPRRHRRAARARGAEHRSVEEVVGGAVRHYVETQRRSERLDQVLDEELPRYTEALERLGQ